MMPGEGERWTIKRKPASAEERRGGVLRDQAVQGPDTDWIEVVPASRAEAAESALTEALDALDEGGGPAEATRIRSQIEGSNDG